MATTRRTIDRLSRQAGGRPLSRHARASLDDACDELEAFTHEVLATWPPDKVDTFLDDLAALTADVERIVNRGRR